MLPVGISNEIGETASKSPKRRVSSFAAIIRTRLSLTSAKREAQPGWRSGIYRI